MQYDVIVVGGSYSGMAAALQLLRARRKVLILDAGVRRNRFASHSHGFLTQDGIDPAVIAETARAQLLAYPTLTVKETLAISASGAIDAFKVTDQTGSIHEGRRILFATGVADELPEIEGLEERWGKNVFHCPYCHGYELNQGRIAVIATGPNSLHQGLMLPEWGPTTFFTNRAIDLDDQMRRDLAAKDVTIQDTPILRLSGGLEIHLEDGRSLSFAGGFTAPRCAPSSRIAETLGCETEVTPFGEQVRTSASKETTIPGAFACGDAAKIPHSVSLAVADGAWAGANIHRTLIL